MKITFATLFFTLVTLYCFNGATSSVIQVLMRDNSTYYGYLNKLNSEIEWMRKQSNPKINMGYSVVMRIDDHDALQLGQKYLQDMKLVPVKPGIFGKLKNSFPAVWQQPPAPLPRKARIIWGPYLYIAFRFQPYNGEDPHVKQELRMYIAIKGTTTVLTAQLYKIPDRSSLYQDHRMDPAVMNRWDEDIREEKRRRIY